MRADDPNLPQLRTVAEALGELREQIVFVGGAIAGLLVSDPAADTVRATMDVDAVVAADRARFQKIERQVAAKGFVRDVESGIICRWRHARSNVPFDLMPAMDDVLGFTNRWYSLAIDTAQRVDLGNGLEIHMLTASAFVATKLEAFAGRGRGDILGSHDVEDILNVVDGRPEFAQELAKAPGEMRLAIKAGLAHLLQRPVFRNVPPGMLADADRTEVVLTRLQDLSRAE
ncbi:hypothetical protein [Ramlibacter sp.]|uniref:hypothetical protein n=1 Tax=Ramlibacter sp. TaxID=1917967 RepID=UPI003D147E8A